MSDLKSKIEDIYFKEFNQESYITVRTADLENVIKNLDWSVTQETILEKLTKCHNQGHLGFHFIDGCFPTVVIDKFISNLFDKTEYICSRYCESHNKMSLYVNVHKLDIPIEEKKFSYDERGRKLADYCYDC